MQPLKNSPTTKFDYFDKSQVDVLPDSVYGFTSALVVIVFPM